MIPCIASYPIQPVASAERQFRLAVLPRQRRHRVVIVRHMAERHAPCPVGEFEDRVARVRRAGFDDMRKRMGVAIAGRADAAGIDDQPAVAKPDRAREMGVGAQDQRLRDSLGALLDRIERRHPHRAVGSTVSSQ